MHREESGWKSHQQPIYSL